MDFILALWGVLGALYILYIVVDYHGLLVKYGQVRLAGEVYILGPIAVAGCVLFLWHS